MKLKNRIKSYNFWVSLASAILLLINSVGKRFNFSVDQNLYNDLFTSFCGILVLLGIIVPPTNVKNDFEGDNEISKENPIEKNSENGLQNSEIYDEDIKIQCNNCENHSQSMENDLQDKNNLSKEIKDN